MKRKIYTQPKLLIKFCTQVDVLSDSNDDLNWDWNN